jgi:hypothetical protein
MYPSASPFIYILHFLVVCICIVAAIFAGVSMGQPLAILSLLALKFLPEVPLVPEPEMQPEDPPLYHGEDTPGPLGFLTPAERAEQ